MSEKHILIRYEECAKFERRKFERGYIVLKEYEDFYLCGKVDANNNVMYRECFSKFDIDGVPETPRLSHPFWKGMIIKNTNKKKRWFQW